MVDHLPEDGTSDEFDAALGRVVGASAALEAMVGIVLMHAMSDNVGRAAIVIANQPYKWLSTSLRMLATGGMKPHPLQDALVEVLKAADAAMQRRNEVAHGVQRSGHVARLRRSKGGELRFERTEMTVDDLSQLVEDLRATRARLVDLIPLLRQAGFMYQSPGLAE